MQPCVGLAEVTTGSVVILSSYSKLNLKLQLSHNVHTNRLMMIL